MMIDTFPELDTTSKRRPDNLAQTEAAIISTALLDLSALDRIAGKLQAHHFRDDNNKKIFHHLLTARASGSSYVEHFEVANALGLATDHLLLIQQQTDYEVRPLDRLNGRAARVLSEYRKRQLQDATARLAAGTGSAAEVQAALELIDAASKPSAPRLRPVSIADVLTNPQPPHPFIWGPYVPCEALTLLSAHGGVGKSGFGLQLASHVALGMTFLGHQTRRTNAMFFSAEDAESILRLRLASVCRNHEIEPAQLAQHLHALDATDAAVLWSTNGPSSGPGSTTENYAELARYIEQHEIGFLVVDNASDSYGGDRNDKSAVTQFVRALVRLVRAHGGAVVLLSHVNRTTASRSQQATGSYSDSVAWHNAARSRLFLEGDEGTHLKTLKHEKCNYGPSGDELNLLSLPGCGLALAHELDPDPGRISAEATNTAAVLGLIQGLYDKGIYISTSRSAGNAYTVLHTQPGFPHGLEKRGFWTLMDAAEHRGQLKRETYINSERKPRERWAIAPVRQSAPVL